MKKILLPVAAAVVFSAAVSAQNSPNVTYIKSPEFKNQIYLYSVRYFKIKVANP